MTSSENKKKKALLLGAGFSAPLGMPLVSTMTKLLLSKGFERTAANPDGRCLFSQLAMLNYADVIQGKSSATNYEQHIGKLEDDTLTALNAQLEDELQFALTERYGFLELIRDVLIDCEQQSDYPILLGYKLYSGISHLANENHPLNIFSLNHDCIVEKLSSLLRIPLATRFSRTLPSSRLTASLSLAREMLPIKKNPAVRINRSSAGAKDSEVQYFQEGDGGINLTKLHGSINQFIDVTDPNNVDYVEICTTSHAWHWNRFIREMDELLKAGELNPALNHFHITKGDSKFRLRNTLLSGSNKFTCDSQVLNNSASAPFASVIDGKSGGQIMIQCDPEVRTPLSDRFLEEQFQFFRKEMNSIDHLIAIGYSLGDSHINDVIVDWLASKESRLLEIVKPGMEPLPPAFQEPERMGRVQRRDTDTLSYLASLCSGRIDDSTRRDFDAAIKSIERQQRLACEKADRLALPLSGVRLPDLGTQQDRSISSIKDMSIQDLRTAIESGLSFPGAPRHEPSTPANRKDLHFKAWLHYGVVVELLDLNKDEQRNLLGINDEEASLQINSDEGLLSNAVFGRITSLLTLFSALLERGFETHEMRIWLRTENQYLGESPIQALLSGNGSEAAVISLAESSQPSTT